MPRESQGTSKAKARKSSAASLSAKKAAGTAGKAKSPGRAPKSKPTTRPKKATATPDRKALLSQVVHQAAQFALEKKATDVKILDLSQITTMTDYFVIATGDSDRQVKAIAENVIVEMRDELGQIPWKSEGWDSLKWVILDFVDFVVHVLQAEARTFYNIERMWADAPTEVVQDKLAAKPAKKTKRAAASKADPDKVRVISRKESPGL